MRALVGGRSELYPCQFNCHGSVPYLYVFASISTWSSSRYPSLVLSFLLPIFLHFRALISKLRLEFLWAQRPPHHLPAEQTRILTSVVPDFITSFSLKTVQLTVFQVPYCSTPPTPQSALRQPYTSRFKPQLFLDDYNHKPFSLVEAIDHVHCEFTGRVFVRGNMARLIFRN